MSLELKLPISWFLHRYWEWRSITAPFAIKNKICWKSQIKTLNHTHWDINGIYPACNKQLPIKCRRRRSQTHLSKSKQRFQPTTKSTTRTRPTRTRLFVSIYPNVYICTSVVYSTLCESGKQSNYNWSTWLHLHLARTQLPPLARSYGKSPTHRWGAQRNQRK